MATVTLSRCNWQWIGRCFLASALIVLAPPVWCANWDARTRLTNTVIKDADIKTAFDRAISPQFMQAFPSSRFGIYVLVDKSNAKEPTHGVVYIMIGLCKRRPDGSYDLPEVTYSSMLALGNDNPTTEHQMVSERLAEQAGAFSNLAVQNANRLR